MENIDKLFDSLGEQIKNNNNNYIFINKIYNNNYNDMHCDKPDVTDSSNQTDIIENNPNVTNTTNTSNTSNTTHTSNHC